MVRVLHPGFYTSIQDLGRKDYQHLGVPISGAMDLEAAKIANAILGNNEHCAVLEMTMVGPKLEFTCNSAVSVTGANLSPTLNGVRINNYLAINVNKGDVIEFGSLKKGFRSYLAVSGGFQTAFVLNSRSMYKGVTQTPLLQKGDMLAIESKNYVSNKNASIKPNTDYIENHIIQVYKGPEFYKLNAIQISSLFDKDFTIAKENNRMAYQLNELIENNLKDIITSLVLPGTVQLTPSGKLIVLMRDCQTTGGYPRILQLSVVSINNLAQKFTGNKIKFRLIS
ncbi:biotin-dependent carboxyltransferase family protein [Flavobacteriaceae bacterium S0825]|uniref:5-oxoprolinase subunit C family protein n=1 Tax=Gaetbulibacter sp. S0825 TaxID=2720084 RepID=UPI00143089C8|nr:biotin-dependent carboxyltransferase family protein [Gaetbulibacter sp. S0825]MCK0109553.1 biotin-dependent carboxyltransferase family protein [Flavobacteriaceae bacterium S0825]NIX65186.1 biotin-dependent carboxyltransferase family protein [Gaetbulibacter sp. S0825]